MSINPLPLHMSCLGVSTDLVRGIRAQQGHSQSSDYAQKFNNIKAKLQASTQAKTVASAQANAQVPLSAQSLLSRSMVQHSAPQPFKHVPVSAEAYQAALAASLAKVPVPRAKLVCSSLALESSRLHSSMPAYQTDFSAIADSSVGGGGLPRPYGRFTAPRRGDGNAVWERLPPLNERMGGSSGVEAGSSSTSRKASSAGPSTSPSKGSPSRHHTKIRCSVPSYRSEYLAIVRGEAQDTLGEGYSSLRRPELCKTNFLLPAATFLTEAPPLPSYLRVDCGHAATIDHLTSDVTVTLDYPHPYEQQGPLNAMQRQLDGRSAVAAEQRSNSSSADLQTHAVMQRSAAAGENVLGALMASSSQDRHHLRQEASAVAATGMPGSAASTGHGHGVGVGGSGSHPGRPRSATQSDTAPAFPCGVGGRRVGLLPAEMSLPRRYVPPGR